MLKNIYKNQINQNVVVYAADKVEKLKNAFWNAFGIYEQATFCDQNEIKDTVHIFITCISNQYVFLNAHKPRSSFKVK